MNMEIIKKVEEKDPINNEYAIKLRDKIEELNVNPRDVIYHTLDRLISYISKNKPEDLSDEVKGLIDDIQESVRGVQEKHRIDDLREVE